MRRLKYISPLPLFGQGLHLDQGGGRTLVKLTIIMLTFLFIMGPVWPALAQIVEQPILPIDQGITAPTDTKIDPAQIEAPSADVKIEEPITLPEESVPSSETATDEQAAHEETTTPEGSPAMNPVDEGTTQQSSVQKNQPKLPEADESTGALVYRYPFSLPPGRNGFQPELELSYNNQNAEEGSIFGYGWSLSIPYIERLNKHGAEQMYTRNDFSSSLSGEMVDLGNGNFGSKIESGEFLNYSFSNNTWIVKDKKGINYKFGNTAQARQDNPTDSTKVYKWMLEEVRDVNDNFVRYEYIKDQGQIYPSKILYTGSGSADGIFEVELFKQLRVDINTVNKSVFTVSTAYIINKILIKINTVWVGKYEFVYEVGDNNASSILQSIHETYRDETSLIEVSLPLTQFNYGTSTKSWTQETTNLVLPNDLFFNRYYNGADKGGRVLDINGDGLQDLLISYYYGENNDKRIYINNGSSWVLSNSWTIPENVWTAQANERGTGLQVADLNADNLPDFIVSYYIAEGNFDQRVYLNNGINGWTQVNWQVPNIFFSQSNNTDPGGRIGDINGDGLADLFISHYCPSCYPIPTVDQRVYLNNGSGWTQDTTWLFPEDLHLSNYYNGKDQGTRLIDINGDGLLDAVTSLQQDYTLLKKRVYLNTGTGWVTDMTGWILPDDVIFANWNGFDLGWRAVDINSDGLPDLVKSFSMSNVIYQKVYLNNGNNGWVDTTSEWSLPSFRFADYQTGWDQGVRVLDINGDGMEDIVISQHENAGGHDQRVFLHNGNKPNQLISISYVNGGSSDIFYKTTPFYQHDGTLLNSRLPIILQTVSDIITNNGFGNTITRSYVYEGGGYWYSNPFDKKFAGFGKIMKTDAEGNKTITYYHQGNETNSALGEYDDHSSKIGYPYRVEQRDSADNLYNVSISKWENVDLGSSRHFVKNTQSVQMAYDGNSTHRDTAASSTYNNTNGNLTQNISWGEVVGSDDGTFTDTGTDKITTDYTYATGGSWGVTGLPATELTADQSAAKVKESRYYYDLLALGSVGKGNLTKQEAWVIGSTYIDTENTYNSYGLVTQTLDGRNKPTSYIYDSYNLYPVTVTNALNQSTQYLYDYSLGKPKQVTDANGAISKTIYDGLDRVVEQKQSDRLTPATLVTSATYVYTYLPVGLQTQETKYLDSTTSVEAYSYTDGLGRAIQSRVEAETPGQFTVSDIVYNSRGLKQKESLPYFSSGSGRTAATSEANLYNTYVYDSAGRVIATTNAVGTVTTTYDDWKTTVTDARGNPKHAYVDAYGRLVKVEEVNGGTYATMYDYNGQGLLIKITDAAGNIRNFTYDGLGRRLTAQDLHAPADATFGTWAYNYDAAGNLLTKLDPKNQNIVYSYDDLNRQLTEDFTGQTGVEVTYAYDNCPRGQGRLCSVTSSALTETREYDALGSTSLEQKTINSTLYTTSYSYDRQGNQVLLTNPDGSQVKNTYNTAGQLEQVQRKEASDADFSDVVTNYNYGPHGQVTIQENANGTTTTNTYDAAELYRLRSKVTTSPVGEMPLGGGGAQFTTSALYEATAVRAEEYDISQANVGSDYDSASLIKQDYQLANAAFVKLAPDADGVRIEVGNVTKDEFTPELRLNRWNGESKLKIAPNLTGIAKSQQILRLEGNIIKLLTPKEEYHFYDILPNAQHPQGAYEFEVVWPHKPQSNVVTLNIEKQNLAFYYQPALNSQPQEEGLSCTETQCIDTSGNVVMERPENAVGSYAVYHSSKQGDYSKMGGHNYGSGKAFHIYRPKIVDAVGKWVWGELNVDEQDGTLSITVPQSFLNGATYPVIVDPTFGYTTAGWVASGQTVSNITIYSPNASATVTGLSVYVHAGIPSLMSVALAVYSGGSLISNSAGQAVLSGSNWNTAAGLSIPVSNTGYYLAWLTNNANSGNGRIAFDDTGTYWQRFLGAVYPNFHSQITWSPITSYRTHSVYATYTLPNTTPSSPTSLLAEGLANPVDITDTTPEFSAIYNDLDSGDSAVHYRIQVTNTQGNWTNPLWDSGQTAMAATPAGTRSPDIAYNSAPLALDGSTYYWRIKFWDGAGAEGVWSSGDDYFVMHYVPPAALQDITYTYDANGNITRLVDGSQTNTAKTVDYTYDDLNRLLTAVTTGATNEQNYSQAYVYDAIGNIISGPAGAYIYAGNQGSSYANPHAATSINGVAYVYDNNGNLLSDGIRTYAWDYNNRLVQASIPGQPGAPITTSFYPANGDGSIYRNGTSWNTVRNATSGSSANYTGTTLNVNTGKSSSTNYRIQRAFLPFNTASLPDDAAITSAKLKVYVGSKLNNDNDSYDWVTVVQGFEPSTTSLTTADYDLAGTINNPVEGLDAAQRKDITSVPTGAHLVFDLNSIGQAWISKTGATKLALREGHDVINSAFVGSSGQYNQLTIRTGEYSGTAYDPILEVTYTTPPPMTIITYAYDSQGQRVKIINGGVTTVYPTSNYNTDGTQAMKHIMAGGVVATVKGTGATAVPYYVATDHLTGSNVVTTSTGTQEELMDYYPFGAIRLDEKAGTFSEQRKFAGQEYDVDTGLSYMNARYYDGLVGRFISQDPLEIVGFQTTDANKFVQVISNPQNWNTYSYALNNPLINVDPSGLYTRAVHGTLPLENISNARAVWQDPTNPLIQNASQTFNEPAELFEWSGGDNHWERLYAASRLAAEINAHPFQPGEQLNLVTHSHGGNIAFLVSQMIDRKIDNLVTFALPVRSDYQPDSSKISNMVNLYSQADLPQVMAGGTYSMSGLLGKAFGDMGEKMGNYLGLGEFGLAGYKVQGAKNIDVTRYSWNPFTAHTNVWQSTKAWNQGVVPNIIK